MAHPLTPIADILAITCVALVPLMAMHISDAEAQAQAEIAAVEWKLARELKTLKSCEKFAINCLSGRKLNVAGTTFVDCVKLRD